METSQNMHEYTVGADESFNFMGGGTWDEGGANSIGDGGSYHRHATNGVEPPEPETLPINHPPYAPIGGTNNPGLPSDDTAGLRNGTGVGMPLTLSGTFTNNLDPVFFQTPNGVNPVQIGSEYPDTQSGTSFNGVAGIFTPSLSPLTTNYPSFPTEGTVGSQSDSQYRPAVVPGLQSSPVFFPGDYFTNHGADGIGDAIYTSQTSPPAVQRPLENAAPMEIDRGNGVEENISIEDNGPTSACHLSGRESTLHNQHYAPPNAGAAGVWDTGDGNATILQQVQTPRHGAMPVNNEGFDVFGENVPSREVANFALALLGRDLATHAQRHLSPNAGAFHVGNAGADSRSAHQPLQDPRRDAMPVNEGFDVHEEPVRTRGRESAFACVSRGCDRTFDTEHQMNEHQASHLPVCPQCSKRFADERGLDRHLETHQGGKPWVCTFQNCNKRFTRKDNTLRHLEITHKFSRDDNQRGRFVEKDPAQVILN